jgi:hypothetical protein
MAIGYDADDGDPWSPPYPVSNHYWSKMGPPSAIEVSFVGHVFPTLPSFVMATTRQNEPMGEN